MSPRGGTILRKQSSGELRRLSGGARPQVGKLWVLGVPGLWRRGAGQGTALIGIFWPGWKRLSELVIAGTKQDHLRRSRWSHVRQGQQCRQKFQCQDLRTSVERVA